MGSLLEDVEPRMEKMFLLLKNEVTIFERLMYKNGNQHRRALYFRRLCQVRRDLRLLQSAHLTDLIQSVAYYFRCTSNGSSSSEGRRQSKHPNSQVQVLKRRLFGVARLLEQMLDPILNAGLHVAGLLGLTFFMPFALTAFSILARLRVLLSQCLHDVVHVFNLFSEWVSEQKHLNCKSEKLPASLECKWDGMKMVLTATFTNHEDVNVENEGLVEDSNGRKYSILGSLVSAQVAMELEGPVEMMPSPDVTWKAREDEGLGASVMAPCADKNLEAQNSSEKRHVGDQELYEKGKAEEFRARRDSSVTVPKRKAAYVSVESTTSSREAEKRKEREMHPPKRQKRETLFDMLLGLGDGMTPKSLF